MLLDRIYYRNNCFFLVLFYFRHLFLVFLRIRDINFPVCNPGCTYKYHLSLSFLRAYGWRIKSVSMRRPGRTRQGVIMLKSPISLKLGTNVRYQELTYVKECQVQILNSLGDPGSPCKNRHFARLCIIN